jgi:amino acid transporter
MLFFAFTGAECALSASGGIRNASNTVPMGLLIGNGGLLMLYVGLQTVAQGVLGPELANQTEPPVAAVAVEVFGGWGGKMLLAGVVISIYGAISGDMLGAPRVIFASSMDGNLPRFLSKVHPKYKTPHVAVIFFAAVVCVFALSGTFKYLAVFATGSLLLIDLGVGLAVLRFRQRDGLPKTGEFRLPFRASHSVIELPHRRLAAPARAGRRSHQHCRTYQRLGRRIHRSSYGSRIMERHQVGGLAARSFERAVISWSLGVRNRLPSRSPSH